jgi:hypothetical protein
MRGGPLAMFLSIARGTPSGERPSRRGVNCSRRRTGATRKPRAFFTLLVEHGEDRTRTTIDATLCGFSSLLAVPDG